MNNNQAEYELIREHYVKGELRKRVRINAYKKYIPMDVLGNVRTDVQHHNIPRVMVSMDCLLGDMNRPDVIEIARQHKMTAPLSYVRYIVIKAGVF